MYPCPPHHLCWKTRVEIKLSSTYLDRARPAVINCLTLFIRNLAHSLFKICLVSFLAMPSLYVVARSLGLHPSLHVFRRSAPWPVGKLNWSNSTIISCKVERNTRSIVSVMFHERSLVFVSRISSYIYVRPQLISYSNIKVIGHSAEGRSGERGENGVQLLFWLIGPDQHLTKPIGLNQ